MLIQHRFPRTDSWQAYAGMERKALKKFVRTLRQSAAEMRVLNSKTFGLVLVNSDDTRHLAHLPERLDRYAELLEAALATYGPKKRWHSHLTRFLLTSQVITSTGRPHDEEVSALLAAVWGKSCSVQAQSQWRHENFDRLQSRYSPFDLA
jgi:hypothetical protein